MAAEDDVASVAVLDEPIRRKIFEFLRHARVSKSREDVSEELGISRKLAAFHLDKLLERGLLKAHYARPPGRSGPGAGRSAKFYEPSDREIEVSIPGRRYDLAGGLLLDAVRSEAPGERAQAAALRVAAEKGRAVGGEIRRERRLRRLGSQRALSVAREVLESTGYEPYTEERGVLALKNCPFHSLAVQAPDTMCSMNQAFIEGLLRGLGNEGVDAVLACKPGDCCVTLRARKR